MQLVDIQYITVPLIAVHRITIYFCCRKCHRKKNVTEMSSAHSKLSIDTKFVFTPLGGNIMHTSPHMVAPSQLEMFIKNTIAQRGQAPLPKDLGLTSDFEGAYFLACT